MKCLKPKPKIIKFFGLYRIPGSALQIQEIQASFDNNESPDLKKYGISPCASLLKKFFKMLPEPLLTYELFDNFMDAAEIQDEEERIKSIKGIKDAMPLPSRRVCHRLVKHLRNVAAYSHVNKMTISNLAIVFAPTLLKGQNETMVQLLKNTPKMTTVVHHLIADFKTIFHDDEKEVGGGDVLEVGEGKDGKKEKEAELELVMIQLGKPLESLQQRIAFFRKKAGRPDEVAKMDFEQLKLEKKLIKKELRSYDQVFKYKNGRFPTKSEKEPLRPLYNRYRKVKARFERLERGETGHDEPEPEPEHEPEPVEEDKIEEEKRSRKRKMDAKAEKEMTGTIARLTDDEDVQRMLIKSNRFKGLLTEKRQLQKSLKKYQKEFEAEHGRKMKSVEDRMPMEDSYQRYREIKVEMNRLTEKAKKKAARRRGEH